MDVDRNTGAAIGTPPCPSRRPGASRQAGRVLFMLLAGFFLAACEDTVSPDEICDSGVVVCWNLANANNLVVNDARREGSLLPGSVHGFRISTRLGATYHLVVTRKSGGLRYYLSPGTRVDPGSNTIASRRYPGRFTFTATGSVYSVVIEDVGGLSGTDYAIRVYSYDEPSIPLRETRHLVVNGAGQSFGLLRSGLMRFEFTVETGRDYSVEVETQQGRVATYLSVIASVDADVHELTGQRIDFRTDRDGRMYVAVQDLDRPAGSDFLIRVFGY